MSSKRQHHDPNQPQASSSASQKPAPQKPPTSGWEISKDLLIILLIIMIIMIVIIVIVLVMLFTTIGGPYCGEITEPSVNIRDGESTGTNGSWELMVDSVSTGEELANYQVAVKKGNTIVISATDLDTVKASGATGSGLYLNFSDATDDGKLNGGDWFTLEYTDSTSDYQVIIYWKSSGNNVSSDTGKIEQ